MTDQPAPHPLSDADLLAWAVVLSYRDQQERDGIKILALPFPPCPTCGETVHKVVASWVREPFREEVTIDVQPCEHVHTATFADLERIHDHASEMLASLCLDDRLPGEEGRSTDDIVREAHARVGEPKETSRGPIDWARRQQAERETRQATTPAGTEGTESAPWSQIEAHAFNAVQPALRESGEWLQLSSRRAVARAVLAAVQPHLAGHYQHAVDASIAAEQRAVQAEARLRRYQEWLAEQLAQAETRDQATGEVPVELRISPHNGIVSGLRTALYGLDRIVGAHDAGPTVREAATDDRAYWERKYAGEQP